MAQHRIEFVQLLDALQQHGHLLLQLAHGNAVALGHLLLGLRVGMRQLGQIHHQLLALGQELVQRRIERADHHREAVHGFEQAGEIGALHGQQLQQRFAPRLLIARQNHGLHVRNAVLGEEHVLGAAQADALGAEFRAGLRVARNIGVGAHAEGAAEFVGPAHEGGEHAGSGIGVDGLGLAPEDLAESSRRATASRLP